MLAETVVGAMAKGLFDTIGRTVTELRSRATRERIRIDYSAARDALISHVQFVDSWANTIVLLALRREKRLQDAFVELNLSVGLRRVTPSEQPEAECSLNDLYPFKRHIALLGPPGAGKTTSLKRFAQMAVTDWVEHSGPAVVLVRLRDLEEGSTLAKHLLARLGVTVTGPDVDAAAVAVWESRALERLLGNAGALVLIDGLDELSPDLRLGVERELRDLALAPGDHRVAITCRVAEYRAAFQNVVVYTVLPLTDDQVRSFAGKWVGEEKADGFIVALRSTPYAGTEVIPLMLAHLCAIYERDGRLPPRPTDVLELIVSLLVEEWDRERGVRRQSRYDNFTWRKRERFLQAVAYALALRGRKGTFRHDDLAAVYPLIAGDFGLPAVDAEAVLEELESHTGLVVESGSRSYDWVHLSLQEYLAASHAVREPKAVERLVPALPNEMALVVAMSSSPGEMLEDVFQKVLSLEVGGSRGHFVYAFVARLGSERPLLRPSRRLGWVLAGYLNMVWWLSRHEYARGGDDFAPETWRFANNPIVRRSIDMAVDEAEVTFTEGGFRMRPHADASAPLWLRREHELGFELPKNYSKKIDQLTWDRLTDPTDDSSD